MKNLIVSTRNGANNLPNPKTEITKPLANKLDNRSENGKTRNEIAKLKFLAQCRFKSHTANSKLPLVVAQHPPYFLRIHMSLCNKILIFSY